MAAERAVLEEVLQSEEIAPDVYRFWTPPGSGRSDIFGGQVAGQALRAALFTVQPDHLPNSIHGYFLRRGQPELPLDIHIERIRAGRTYTSRRVDVRQDGKTIFAMLASFHLEEPGAEYDHPMPDGVPPADQVPEKAEENFWHPVMEMRSIESEDHLVQWWGRIRGAFAADPATQYCALLYASDMRAGGAVISAAGFDIGRRLESTLENHAPGNFGSLDHAVWFHRTPDVTKWFYCDARPLTVRDSRGLVIGRIFDSDGRHLATFTQEMFVKAGEIPGARRLRY
jgi:acyl-CoA thioesterase-2